MNPTNKIRIAIGALAVMLFVFRKRLIKMLGVERMHQALGVLTPQRVAIGALAVMVLVLLNTCGNNDTDGNAPTAKPTPPVKPTPLLQIKTRSPEEQGAL